MAEYRQNTPFEEIGGEEQSSNSGNTGLPFGLCKKYNIPIGKNWTPRDAWNALAGIGVYPPWTKKGKSGRYSVENSEQERTKKQSSISVEQTAVTEATREKFADKLIKAKSNVAKIKPQDAWRVTSYTADELKEKYPNAKLFTTPGGSTFAVNKDGDIISVCRNPNDKQYRGKDLIAMAVENGGTKLDSYSGNHDFYLKQGFEPVSWCVFDKRYAPNDWTPIRDKEEPIIFYRYTGKIGNESVEDFTSRIKASKDYDTAMEIRDKSME